MKSLLVWNSLMVRLRDNRHSYSTRHVVAAETVCLHFAAGAAVICAAILKVAPGKEAAP